MFTFAGRLVPDNNESDGANAGSASCCDVDNNSENSERTNSDLGADEKKVPRIPDGTMQSDKVTTFSPNIGKGVEVNACDEANFGCKSSSEANSSGKSNSLNRWAANMDTAPGNGSDDPNLEGGVRLGGEQYVVVGVCVVVVRLMVEYAECSMTLHMAAQSLLAGLADLLKRYNSDTCRLLLEAGAVSLGGLRTISTRCDQTTLTDK